MEWRRDETRGERPARPSVYIRTSRRAARRGGSPLSCVLRSGILLTSGAELFATSDHFNYCTTLSAQLRGSTVPISAIIAVKR